ncbi:MAG: response regulator [Bacteroidetes bacterium]|nr:response regulator [Bacteroidota bacterium]
MIKKEVLIVDDSNTNNFLLQSILESEGYKTSIAFSGQEALKLITNEKPDLVLLDIMMPNLDGFTVLKQLQGNYETKQIPVVFVTAKNEETLWQKAIDSGARDLLLKPIDVNKVLDVVKKILIN